MNKSLKTLHKISYLHCSKRNLESFEKVVRKEAAQHFMRSMDQNNTTIVRKKHNFKY
jgi:hypothetical protein